MPSPSLDRQPSERMQPAPQNLQSAGMLTNRILIRECMGLVSGSLSSPRVLRHVKSLGREKVMSSLTSSSNRGLLARSLVGPVCMLAGLLLTTSRAAAQDFAGFRGTVTDPSGAAVVGVEIKLT